VLVLILLLLQSADLSVQVPPGLLQVLDLLGRILLPGAPYVLHRAAQAQAHMLDDLDALHPGRVAIVVPWVVDRIVLHPTLHRMA
jgi:hypothetical protein